MKVPFNIPAILGTEIDVIKDVLESQKLSGNGVFSKKCDDWFKENLGCHGAIPVPSGTAALEMGLMLANISHGDEVILPSHTFTSTATAIVLHGGVPVFVDAEPETLNINTALIEQAITPKTKAIIPVHYAGVSCDMHHIMKIAKQYNLTILEDAAQCISARDQNGMVGSQGHMSIFSFHETKNITCGEGGMLCINDPSLWERAEIIRDKGTNRQKFFRGQVDKYSWQDKGSSYLMSELQAGYLYAQLQACEKIIQDRLETWNFYHRALEDMQNQGKLRRPIIPEGAAHNAHVYYILLPSDEERKHVQKSLNDQGVNAVTHYVPLHSSDAGKKYGYVAGEMSETDDFTSRLLRLPLFYGLAQEQRDHVIKTLLKALA